MSSTAIDLSGGPAFFTQLLDGNSAEGAGIRELTLSEINAVSGGHHIPEINWAEVAHAGIVGGLGGAGAFIGALIGAGATAPSGPGAIAGGLAGATIGGLAGTALGEYLWQAFASSWFGGGSGSG